MAGSIQFTVEGLTLRGFYKTMYLWVPNRGERLECKVNTNGAISAFKKEISIGNVQKEWSKHYREWLDAGGKLEAIVYGLHKKHRNKSEEVPVIYLFSGDRKKRLINIMRSIKRETEKRAKLKKSLKYHNGDESENLLQMNADILIKLESMERQSKQLEFSISGMTIRGFFKYKEIWVPEIGNRHKCFVSETGAIATKINEDITISICGHIPTEVQKPWKKFLKEGGKLTAVVADPPKNHRSKGEEVPAYYIFTGEMTCVLQNVRRSIIADIEQKRKKKKSLCVCMGDVTQNLKVKHDITASGQSPAVAGKASDVSNKHFSVNDEESTTSDENSSSDDTNQRVSNVKVRRKRGLLEDSNGVNTIKKLKKSPQNGMFSPTPEDYEIKLNEKDFNTLAKIIGKNWKHLGHQLCLDDVQISHIDMDTNNYTIPDKIYRMLMKWGSECPENNSLGTLIEAVNEWRPELEINLKRYDEFVTAKRQQAHSGE